ncbi:hypothetical protein [Erwinia sp. 9145]|uniref:hypothetical protein n=1 Tax=Erwinia sp. 9145 TaxID=1500895 RepID=UPI000556C320|nr:hypothetical protein [Erwinia sp. 9145]
MKREITEACLLENGFTEKNINFLRKILARPESKGQTLHSLIDDLRKRFWGGVLCLLIMTVVCLYWLVNYEKTHALAYIVTIIFGVLVIFHLTPFSLSLKAYRFHKRMK